MKRFHLFEFEDLRWFPSAIRNYMTDYLRTSSERFDCFGPAISEIREILDTRDCSRIVDLASGGGGQWRVLLPRMVTDHPDVQLTLTDLYPNVPALRTLQCQFADRVRVEATPIDARNVPPRLGGLRTMFFGLHHFKPPDATAILADAVHEGVPIAVFEAQCRDSGHTLRFCFAPLFVLLLTPTIRPFSLRRLLFTYVVPIVPLAIGWDAVMSVLRTYSLPEMEQMAKEADPNGQYRWKADVIVRPQQSIQFLTGIPNAT